MHGLNTIAKINNESFAAAIANYQAQGRYVLVTYGGLHISGIETFEDPLEAVSKFNSPLPFPDVTRKILPPTARRPAPRDQSEDRTLGDYVARKQAAAGLDLDSGEFIPADQLGVDHHRV
jgi:hypothetical protein